MPKKWITIAVLCGAVLLTGCLKKEQAAKELVTDGRMADPAVTERDEDLLVGDLGVERIVLPQLLRSLEQGRAQTATLLDPHGFPLIHRFPDPTVKPLRGGYAENVIETAKSYLHTPYEYGSDRTNPLTFDCSDFTRWVYLDALGMDLPWDSRSQAAYVRAFSKRIYTDFSKARRGDLLFFTRYLGNKPEDYQGLTEAEKPISHMGIYLGNGKLIHCASKETGGVRIDQIRWKHLQYRFLFGGGIL
ncbi:C40 family peptidase [Paenibacillus hamazuiensis]|uniref:C40 family peptidase n=1 Tax=Paenibacillus hamazuiensis TaxID=2936508 RepID=UPI00200E2483|nr:C40 family peptidase [Paenibacillus hamazuiensis]